MILLDTNILIDYTRDKVEAIEYMEDLKEPPYISALTVAELYAGVRDNELEDLRAAMELCNITPLNEEIAQQGGLFRRDYGPSHGTDLMDGMIAATAKEIGAELISLNLKHFPMLDQVRSPY